MSATATEQVQQVQAPAWSGYRNERPISGRPTSSRVGTRVKQPERLPDQYYRDPQPVEEIPRPPGSPLKQQRPPSSPVKRPPSSPVKHDRQKSAGRRENDLMDQVGRPKSRLEYLGFEEYDGGKPSQVGRRIPAKMELPRSTSTPHLATEPAEENFAEPVQTKAAVSSPRENQTTTKNEGDYFSRPNTHQYKSLKNLENSSYTPSAFSQSPSRPTTAVGDSSMRSSRSMHALPIVRKRESFDFQQPRDLLIDTTNRRDFRYDQKVS